MWLYMKQVGNAIFLPVITQELWKTETDIITWWRWSILTKLITKKICWNSVIFTIYQAKYLLYMCVLQWSIFTKFIKNTALNKRLLSCQAWWNKGIFANLWFALLLLFQLAGLRLAYANINPILIDSVYTSDMENIPCYTIIITQLFSQWLLKDLSQKLKLHVLLARTPKSMSLYFTI